MIGRWRRRSGGQSGPGDRPSYSWQVPAGPVVHRARPDVPPGSVEGLDRAVNLLMEFTRDGSVPASALVNPLLVVWDAAHAVGAEVAGPVEALLTAAVRRSTIAADEIRECTQEVRALAVQEAVLSDLVRG